MRRAYPVGVVREAESPLLAAAAAAGDPDAVMRRAAAGVAHHTAVLLRERTGGTYGRTVLLLVGSGDNGGDALYAGAVLAGRGCRVGALLLTPDKAHPRALAAFRRAGGRVVDAPDELRCTPDAAVDGVVGLGGTGPLREPAAGVVAELTARGVPLVAVDLPSGVDADTGTVHPAHVPATVTVTFGLLRRAHLLAGPACGRVELVDIGLADPALAEPGAAEPGAAEPGGAEPGGAEPGVGTLRAPDPADVGAAWPVPGPDDDKYTQGVVAVRAGSERYPGAGVLCASAAVAATSGMVRYVGSGSAAVVAARPEIVCHPTVAEAGAAQAWVVGPGAGTDAAAVADLERILGLGRPTLVDADALTCVAEHPVLLRHASAPVLLTPHGREFDRLTGGWDRSDRAGALRRYVAGLRDRGVDATVLLKGRVTLVDDGETAWAVDTGSSWAATAGSGDVLSGMTGALLASGPGADGPAWPAVVAVVAHAAAARDAATHGGRTGTPRGPAPAGTVPDGTTPAGSAPIGASDLLAALPGAIARLRGS